MAEFPSTFDPPIHPSASSSSCGASDDSFEDACSICLEPFTTDDPATVTNCKHEYHLQCIVEWSQRSKECPICWQILSLKDPASQELLAAVEGERSSRSSHIFVTREEFENEHEAPYVDDSDFNERIMQHLAAAVTRARFMSRRDRQRSSDFGSPPGPANAPEVQQTQNSPEYQSSGYGSSEGDSPTSMTPLSTHGQSPADAISSLVNMFSSADVNREGPLKPRNLLTQPPTDVPQKSSVSELNSISESIKSKFSAASARYKESISKGTRGLKEKLMARNNSVKELSKGVQREMSVGIAGVTRMIERLDPLSKRSVVSVPVSDSNMGTSNFSYKGKGVQENVIARSVDAKNGENAHYLSTNTSCHASATIPGRLEISHTQSEN